MDGAGSDTAFLRILISLYAILFFSFYVTDLDVYLSVKGLLPINSIVLLLAALSTLPFLVLLSDRPDLFLERLAESLVRSSVPIFLFILWIVMHALQATRVDISGPDTDFARIFPIFQFVFILFGMALAAAKALSGNCIRLGLAATIAVLGSSVMAETIHPGLLGSTASRSGGFALNANVAAFILNAALACFLDFRRARGTDLVAILFTLVAVLCTLSRSGLTQFVIVAGAYFAVYGHRAFTSERSAERLGFLAGIVLVAFVVAGAMTALGTSLSTSDPELRERIETLTLRGDAVYEDPYRYMLLEHYFRLALEHPLFGLGTAYTTTTAVHGAPLGLGPHNMFLRAWIDHGLVGLSLYVAILVSLLLANIAQRNINGVILTLLVIEYSFFSHNPFDTTATHLFAGLALGHSFLRQEGT
jgi:O-antigen ligase